MTPKRMIMGFVLLVFVLLVFAALKQLGILPDKEAECRDRGEVYFREVGSYPTLSDGRWAIDVAKERCARTTTAF